MNIINLVGSEFVGIVRGVPYSNKNEQDMLSFFREYCDYEKINSIITDGIDMLGVVFKELNFEKELNNNITLIISELYEYYEQLLKEKADFIIGTNIYEEE